MSTESSPTLRDLIYAPVEPVAGCRCSPSSSSSFFASSCSSSLAVSSLCDDQGGQKHSWPTGKPLGNAPANHSQGVSASDNFFGNQLQKSLAETEEEEEEEGKDPHSKSGDEQEVMRKKETKKVLVDRKASISNDDSYTFEDLFGSRAHKRAHKDAGVNAQSSSGFTANPVEGISPFTADFLALRTRRRSARNGQAQPTHLFPAAPGSASTWSVSRPKIYPLSSGAAPYYLPQVIPEATLQEEEGEELALEPEPEPEPEPREVEINEPEEEPPTAPPSSPAAQPPSQRHHHLGYGYSMYGYPPAPPQPPLPPMQHSLPVGGYYPFPMYSNGAGGMPPPYSYPPPSMMPYYPPYWHHAMHHHHNHHQQQQYNPPPPPPSSSSQPCFTPPPPRKNRNTCSKKTVYRQEPTESGDMAPSGTGTGARVRLARPRHSEVNKVLQQLDSLHLDG